MAGLPTGYGLTAQGFIIPSIDVILTTIETDLQAAFGASIDLSSTSNFGQLAGIMSERVSELWNLGLAVYNAQTAEGATGVAEDSVNSLTGCIREGAISSQVGLLLTGTNGTTVTNGIAACVGQNGNQFAFATATLATATSWATTTTYATGAIVTNSSNIYYATAGGVSASTGSGPTGTGSSIPDGVGSLVWSYVGAGAAVASVTATAPTTGPLTGPSGTVTVIVTPVSGWSNVWNPLNAIVGQNVETDSAYRARRDAELGGEGVAYLNAIQAAVLKTDADTINEVTAATVFENYTDGTVNGMPPHSVEALVEGGVNLDVATTLFNTIAAGIQPFGQTNTVTETVLDSVGNPHTVQFSRPQSVPIYAIINVTVNPNSPNFNTSDGGQAAIQSQIVEWGNGLGSGFSVDQSFVSAQAFVANVGAWQVTSCFVGTAPSPAGSEVVITQRQLSTWTAANVTVNITQTVP